MNDQPKFDVLATARLADFICARGLSFPSTLFNVARNSLIDTVGVTIAGRKEDAVKALRASLGTSLQQGRSTLLVTGERTDMMTAALVNATAGHALDYDDVSDPMLGHPSVVLWPAVLAVGEEVGASGSEMLESFIVGLEVILTVSSGLDIATHYGHGWHSTSTIGVLGSTAAVSRLWGLDSQQTRCALGIAASLASGSRQNFGTMTKALHAGTTARNGVFAGSLARNGFTADLNQLEGRLGYFALFGGNGQLEPALDNIGTTWMSLEDGLNVKKYPCCYNTARTADALLELVGRHEIPVGDVNTITLTLQPNGYGPLIHHRPTTGLQGKFSAEYVIATILVDHRVDLKSFTDKKVRRAEVQRLIRKVVTLESPTPPIGPKDWETGYAVVSIDLVDGRNLCARVDVAKGHHRAPLNAEDLAAKFLDCLGYAGSPWNSGDLLGKLLNIESVGSFVGFG